METCTLLSNSKEWQIFAFEGRAGHPDEDPIQLSSPFVQQWQIDTAFKLDGSAYHWHYKSQRSSSINEAVRTAKTFSSDKKIAVLGFSNGGHAAILFVHALAELGIPVEIAVTVDPIKKPSYFFLPDEKALSNSTSTPWINAYQETDDNSLMGAFPLRGNPVSNAKTNDEYTDLGPKGHIAIPLDKRVRKGITDALAKAGVPENKSNTVAALPDTAVSNAVVIW